MDANHKKQTELMAEAKRLAKDPLALKAFGGDQLIVWSVRR